ncbi:MAG: hypothetical protein HW380_2536 [Magnetococcales bacterium]|nr:hypothetical protein [Magnetococcales bacterium]HIJ82953.1 hypothetical protein [Magnetococcales bacterium]
MPTIGNISNPILQSYNGPTLNFFSGNLGKLAQGTKAVNHDARITPESKAGEIQQASRDPRTTPPKLAGLTLEASRGAHFTPPEDSADIRANARSARTPPVVPGGAHLASVDILA